MIVDEDLADHVDLNFGCPVPKVTRKGGGAALPCRIGLFDDIVRAAVREARGAVPVTVKMRVGIDADHLTYREAGLRAQDAGVAHVALHGRTAEEYYGGHADWSRIADLADLLDIPVLGNGDIWEGEDARPHGPRDRAAPASSSAAAASAGRGCSPTSLPPSPGASRGLRPTLGEVAATDAPARRTAGGLDRASSAASTEFRKHVAWYLKGFGAGGELRAALAQSSSLAQLDDLLGPARPRPAVPGGRARAAAGTHHGRAGRLAARGLAGLAGLASRALRRRAG